MLLIFADLFLCKTEISARNLSFIHFPLFLTHMIGKLPEYDYF